MFEAFTLTQSVAFLLALYMLSAGIGLLTDSETFAGVLDDFIDSPALTYLAAIMAFALGGTIVFLHNLWNTPLEIIVSLIGWAALIEGILMLGFRRPFFTLVGAIPLNEGFMKAYGIFVLLLGAALMWLIFS